MLQGHGLTSVQTRLYQTFIGELTHVIYPMPVSRDHGSGCTADKHVRGTSKGIWGLLGLRLFLEITS